MRSMWIDGQIIPLPEPPHGPTGSGGGSWWQSLRAWMKWGIAALAILTCAAGAAETVITGLDADSKVRRVLTDASGRLQTSAPTCVSPVESNTAVGVTVTSVPTTAATSRANVLLCNSPRNAVGVVTCRIDGADPTSAATSAGQVLAIGDCNYYTLGPSVNIRCISDAANTYMLATECR